MSEKSEPSPEALREKRHAVRSALAASITSFEIDEETPSDRRFHGSARYAAVLTGPPGRLHGGLHAYARLFPVLDVLQAHDAARTFPCRMTLSLGKAIGLDEDVSFEGRYAESGESFALETRHDGTDKLRAQMRSEPRADVPLEQFRAAYEAQRSVEPDARIRAAGDLPTAIAKELVIIEASSANRLRLASLAAYLTEAEHVDAAMICVLLDVTAAVVLGYEVKGRCFTVQMDLVLLTETIPEDVDLLALADRNTRDDTSVALRPVQIGERTYGPRAIDVLLADDTLSRAYAYGTVTLIPARRDPA